MKTGFTIIELLVVMAILAIILSFTLGNIIKAVSDAKFRSFLDEVSLIIKKAYIMTKDEEILDKYLVRFSGTSDLVVELIQKDENGERVLDKAKGRGISLNCSLPLELCFTPDGSIVCNGIKNFTELPFSQVVDPSSGKIIKVDSLPPGSVEVIRQVSK